MRLRRPLVVISAVTVAGLATATAGAWASGPAKPTVQLRQTARGKLVADRRGFTLYVFSRDSRNHDACIHISGCLSIWPVMKATGRLTAGPGLSSRLLGAIKLNSGARQVTYAGHPLYHYVGDSQPGQTVYVGLRQAGGFWYAINGAGRLVK